MKYHNCRKTCLGIAKMGERVRVWERLGIPLNVLRMLTGLPFDVVRMPAGRVGEGGNFHLLGNCSQEGPM